MGVVAGDVYVLGTQRLRAPGGAQRRGSGKAPRSSVRARKLHLRPSSTPLALSLNLASPDSVDTPMESPSKRLKMSSPGVETQSDFVSFGEADTEGAPGYGNNDADDQYQPFRTTQDPRPDRERQRNHGHSRGGYDPRNAKDKPKSKHALPGYEPWVLVRTKFARRFVHNTQSRESFWQIPKDVMPGVIEFEQWEKEQKEKAKNAEWAESQLKQMRDKSKVEGSNKDADDTTRDRRRRSESLQREDEEALMAELAAQADQTEDQDTKTVADEVRDLQQRAQEAGLESDSEYEVIEVTDTEGEDEDGEEPATSGLSKDKHVMDEEPQQDDGLVEFGEADIAYQLAAMGEDYGLDQGEYGEAYDEEWEEGAEGLPLSTEDASHLFRDLLDDYGISPFTPWDKVIADESEASILNDDRYTVLPNMRSRKETFDAWAKEKAAQLKEQRAAMEKLDPKIPYLAFLQDKATPKLYWPEFKRKYKKGPELNDRKLSDKDREKLYRDHISRLKLPESTRKADLEALLKGLPLKLFNRGTSLDSLPQQLLAHVHYISLPSGTRDPIIESAIRTLPNAPEADDLTDEQRVEDSKKKEERRRRENAMAERERKVEDEKRRNDKEEARARRDLREEERELQRAMAVPNRGLQSQF